MNVKYSTYLILLDLIRLIILREEHKLWSSSLGVFFFILTSVHFSLVRTFFSEPCFQTASVYVLPSISDTKFHTRRDTTADKNTKDSGLKGSKHYNSSNPLNFLLNQIFVCCSHFQIFELWHIFKRSACYIFISRYLPEFWRWNSNKCIIFSAFISRPTSINVSVFIFVAFMLSPSRFTSSA
jgi:hypothetical protein